MKNEDEDPEDGLIMACSVCNKELEFCNCPDIDERLKKARNDPSFIYKLCKRCQRHYARCKCCDPVWITSWDGVSLENLKEIKNRLGLLKGER